MSGLAPTAAQVEAAAEYRRAAAAARLATKTYRAIRDQFVNGDLDEAEYLIAQRLHREHLAAFEARYPEGAPNA